MFHGINLSSKDAGKKSAIKAAEGRECFLCHWFATARTLFFAAIIRLTDNKAQRNGAWTKHQAFRRRVRTTMFQVRREFQGGGASEAVMALKKLCQFTKKLVVTEAEEEGVIEEEQGDQEGDEPAEKTATFGECEIID